MRYKSLMEQKIEPDPQFKPIADFIKQHNLKKLATNIVKYGIELYKDKIYGDTLKQDQRAFFFYY